MGKTRDLLKKIRGRERSFHAKMGQIKDRNGMDLREAEYIKKRLKEYIEELYKRILMTQITMMVFHSELLLLLSHFSRVHLCETP